MGYLLDSHVLIWLIEEPYRLASETLDLLSDPTSQLYISSYSLFKLTIKSAAGRLNYDPRRQSELTEKGIIVITDPKVLTSYQIFNQDNADPFDNVIIATAIAENHTLITVDNKILDTIVPGLRLLDARRHK